MGGGFQAYLGIEEKKKGGVQGLLREKMLRNVTGGRGKERSLDLNESPPFLVKRSTHGKESRFRRSEGEEGKKKCVKSSQPCKYEGKRSGVRRFGCDEVKGVAKGQWGEKRRRGEIIGRTAR